MHLTVRFLATLFLTGLVGLFAGCKTTPPENVKPQWRALFDGSTIKDWKMVGPGSLRLEKGELVTHGGMGLFWYTREQFADCQIRVVFMPTATNDNSGVFIRMPTPPVDPWDAVHHGYEVQIANMGDITHRTGCLYSFSRAQSIVDAKVGEWNTMVITLDGNKTLVQVNGKLVTVFTESQPIPLKKLPYEPNRGRRPDKGYIGLQNHGAGAEVHFKEVSVRSLK